jgi:hypothetical protein
MPWKGFEDALLEVPVGRSASRARDEKPENL